MQFDEVVQGKDINLRVIEFVICIWVGPGIWVGQGKNNVLIIFDPPT